MRYHLGDIASLAGVMISIVGFAVTLEGVRRSRGAAQMAREAAESARNSIRAFETAVDVSGAITLLEELKVAHRKNDWATMPSRYTTLRKKLIGVRAAGGFTDEQSAVFQATISDLKQMEIMVERALPDLRNPLI